MVRPYVGGGSVCSPRRSFDPGSFARAPRIRKPLKNGRKQQYAARPPRIAPLGWVVESRGKPFDLFCRRPSGEELYVEVKASTGRLEEILVTIGEINFACSNRDSVDLFLLENVKLVSNRASGGEASVAKWNCARNKAIPTHFRYPVQRGASRSNKRIPS